MTDGFAVRDVPDPDAGAAEGAGGHLLVQASQDNARVTITGGRTGDDSNPDTFSIEVYPVRREGEDLLLVCFVNDTKTGSAREKPGISHEVLRVAFGIRSEIEHDHVRLAAAHFAPAGRFAARRRRAGCAA